MSELGTFESSFGVPIAMTVDAGTHTVFVDESEVFGNYTAINRILSLDEPTGAAVEGQQFPGFTSAIVFQRPLF